MKRLRRIIFVSLAATLASLLFGSFIFSCRPVEPPSTPSIPAQVNRKFIPPKEWLEIQLSIIRSPSQWDGIEKAQSGDEIWMFRSPGWQEEMGTAGKCLIRDGIVIDGYVTLVS